MDAISKLHERCKKCKHKNNCDSKRMVACGYLPIQAEIKQPILESMVEPIAIKHTPITINMGENGIPINTSLEELHEQLRKDFYRELRCGFNDF